MTAVNVIVTEKVGYLLTDTACYDLETGEITGCASKVQTYPHSFSAVAVRGPITSWQWATELCGRATSFDNMVHHLPGVLKQGFANIVEAFGDHSIDLICVGYSSSNGRVQAGIARSPDFVFDMGETIMAPILTADEIRAAGIELTDNPPADLLKIVHAQRASIKPGESHAIGGSAVLTVISVRGISQMVLHTWSEDILVKGGYCYEFR